MHRSIKGDVMDQGTNHRPFALTILATSLGFALVQLDVSSINVALARMGADLQTNVVGLQWVVDAYALAFACLLLSAGALGDQIGARRTFIGGLLLFTAASAGCGLASPFFAYMERDRVPTVLRNPDTLECV
jgi:MFS family permease